MPAKKKRKLAEIKINLVPRDPFFKTVFGQGINWALTVGRYIVIFTELLVIISFATRFNLDRQVTDLNKAIEQKKNIVLSYGDLENNFRTLQSKIGSYKQFKQEANLVDIFPKLTEIAPTNVLLENLTIQPNLVRLDGKVTSQQSLNLLINNLTLSQDFFNVSVSKIESLDKDEGGFAFSIQAETKKEATLKKDSATKEGDTGSPSESTTKKSPTEESGADIE